MTSPSNNTCYLPGAELQTEVELLLIDESVINSEAIGAMGESLQLCLSVDGSEWNCKRLVDGPPRLPSLTPGCHVANLELSRSQPGEAGEALRLASSFSVFQVASALRCEPPSPRCPAPASPFRTVGPPMGASFYPRPASAHAAAFAAAHYAPASAVTSALLKLESAATTFRRNSQNGLNAGEDQSVRLVSPSPLYGDVIWSQDVLLEIGRENAAGERKGVAEILMQPNATAEVELCVHLMLIGRALVDDEHVRLARPSGADESSVQLCFPPATSIVEASVPWGHPRGLDGPSPGQAPSARATVTAELITDPFGDFVRVSLPPLLWPSADEVHLGRSVDPGREDGGSGNSEGRPEGIAVAVQAWLFPRTLRCIALDALCASEFDISGVPRHVAQDVANAMMWAVGLPTAPRLIALSPNPRTVASSNSASACSPLENSLGILCASELQDNGRLLADQTLPVLVLCHWAEDLNWLRNQPHRAIVYEKREYAAAGKHGVPRNIGGEASAFLKFIVDYYEDLPAQMIFLHSHRFAYHQEDILILLANARLAEVEAVEYCNLNRVMWGQREDPQQCWLKSNWDPHVDEDCRNISVVDDDDIGWLAGLLGDRPSRLFDRCCAQFIVARRLVWSRPKSVYVEILSRMSASVTDDDSSKGPSSRKWGLLLEWLWHVIFDQPSDRSYQDEPLSATLSHFGVGINASLASATGLQHVDRVMLDRPPCVRNRRAWIPA